MKNKYILTYLRMAQEFAKLSPDENTKVGCILADEETIVQSAFNGYIRGAPDNYIPKISPDKYEYTFHAEHNAILNCARRGISVKGCTAFITHSPCPSCCRILIQSGIKRVFFLTKHKSFRLQALDYSGTLIDHEYYYELRLN